MSFKFEFKIDYEKLTALLDTFLKSHSDELTSIMGKCLILQPNGGNNEQPIITSSPSSIPSPSSPTPNPPPPCPIVPLPSSSTTAAASTVDQQQQPDHKIDNRPLIGDTIPEDPLQNLFSTVNPNNNTTRYQDRNDFLSEGKKSNNPNIKKGYRL